MSTRKLVADVRLTPSHALKRALAMLSAMTGAQVDECLIRRRGSVVDTARNLALHFLVEFERYQVTKLALAFPRDAKTGKPRHWTSPRNNHIQGWEIRDATRPDSDDLFDWLKAHWKDPLSAHRTMLVKRRRAFQAAIAAAEKRRGSKRLEAEDIAGAVTAMIRAHPIMIGKPRSAAAAPSTAVPIVNDGEAMLQILRPAPVMRAAEGLRISHSVGAAHVIQAVAATRSRAEDLLKRCVRMLDIAGHKAMQLGVRPDGERWRFSIEAVPAPPLAALAALLAAIHIAAPSRIVSPIDGALGPTRGLSHATA